MNCKPYPLASISDIAGLRVTVMGLGLNGGGLATARFMASHGAFVTVTDRKTAVELQPSIDALSAFPSIRYVLGTHELEDFSTADVVIKNPGVKLEGNQYLEVAPAIESDISIFLRLTKAPIIAVTGSKGKSSTVSALQFALRESGLPSFLGGNITVSPLTFLEETSPHTPTVLELSSWQLADLRGLGLLDPRVAILTPIMSDHQNWYNGMESYVADKKLIYADQSDSGYLLCNKDDGWGDIFARECKSRPLWYSASRLADGLEGIWLEGDGQGMMRFEGTERVILSKDLAVPGFHMRQNLLNAAGALALFGLNSDTTALALSRFPGIEHRLEHFHQEKGVRWFNDSAATIPEAAAAALSSFNEPVVLLCGGTDKNLDFTPLASVAAKAKKIILLAGTGTDKLIPLLTQKGIDFIGPCADLASLIASARREATSGDVVVFSPGATSFGLFLNEFDRGRKFKENVVSSYSA